jgi:hypothetical protein
MREQNFLLFQSNPFTTPPMRGESTLHATTGYVRSPDFEFAVPELKNSERVNDYILLLIAGSKQKTGTTRARSRFAARSPTRRSP